MCDKCVEINKQIDHFRDVARSILDGQTLRSIDIMIADLEARKAALHPERKA